MRNRHAQFFACLFLVCALACPAPVIGAFAVEEKKVDADYLSTLEKEVVEEINLARQEPQKYAAFVEEFRKFYDGERLHLPGRKRPIVTFEGLAAVDEAIAFLRAQKSLPALEPSKGLSLAAKDHATDLSTNGTQGHRGSDGSTPNARVDRYGIWDGGIGEAIVYDVSTARNMVISLIIDDGTKTRGHRLNVFNANYHFVGVAISPASVSESRCVIDYVNGFKNKDGKH